MYRQSLANTRAFSHDGQESDPRAAEGTTLEADRLQEEEVGVLALECLSIPCPVLCFTMPRQYADMDNSPSGIQSIFQSDHPAQIRGGAIALMKFVDEEFGRPHTAATICEETSFLFRLVTTWTTVQNRFIVLVIAVEHLYRLPVEVPGAGHREADQRNYLELHGAFIEMINGVLRSDDINLIGLSVMDVMLRLLDHIIRLATIEVHSSSPGLLEQLVERLKDCIALLSVHVYYADQVRDMCAAVLIRVKAYPSGNGRSFLNEHRTRGDKPIDEIEPSTAIQPATHDQSGSTKSAPFTSDEARKVALEMVARIIEFANTRGKTATAPSVSNRNRVPVGVWEGTQWLLRDPSEEVRDAYRIALSTWAQYELEDTEENTLDFDAEDCISGLVEKARPAASIRGSIGHSHQSHPQLLMLPYTADNVVSSSRNSSNGTLDRNKPRVTAKDLDDIVNGRRMVPRRVQLDDNPGAAESLDMNNVLATLKTASLRPKRDPVMSAPPY